MKSFVCASVFRLAVTFGAFLGFVAPTAAQRSGDLTGEFLKTYGLSAKHVVSELDFSPLLAAPESEHRDVKAGPFLNAEARETLMAGNQSLAMELLFAHMITEHDMAAKALRSVRFSPLFRRPVWQVRWGVSMSIRGGTVDEANPIGGSGTSRSSRGAGETSEKNASSDLKLALGLVADTLAEAMEYRVSEGNFGRMLNALQITTSDEPEDRSGQSVRRDTGRRTPAESAMNATNSAVEPPPIWLTGVVYLGEGTSAEIVEVARGMGIDLLLHFDVALKSDRDEEIQNTSRCRAIQVSNGKTLGVSTGIDSQESERFSQGGRGTVKDYVKEQIEPLLTAIDQQTKVTKMPQLTANIAKKRVGALFASPVLAGSSKPSLRPLAEIRMYQSLGLLKTSEVDIAFEYAAGDEGLFLLYGPLDERLERARQWAVEAQSSAGAR